MAPGEQRYYLIQASGKPDLPSPQLAGSKAPSGTAYLFEFPFGIFVDPLILPTPQDSWVENVRVRIYPPFLGRPDAPERRIAPSQIPHDPATLPPDHNKVGVKTIAVDYKLGDTRNAIRLDLTPDRGPAFAARIGEQFVGLCRWWTGQWWIGRDDRHVRDYLCNWFEINEQGERLSGINGAMWMRGLYGVERPLSTEMLRNIRGNITNGRHIPLSWDAIYDAIYFQASTHVRRSALEAAIACEAGVAEAAKRLAKSRNCSATQLKKALQSNDFTVKLSQGLFRIAGRDFALEKPDDFTILSRLRDWRGTIAHGEPPLVRCNDNTLRPLEAADLTLTINAVLSSLRWLTEVE